MGRKETIMKVKVKKVKAKPMRKQPRGRDTTGNVKPSAKPTGIPKMRKGYAK
jgi:hypothetical protein